MNQQLKVEAKPSQAKREKQGRLLYAAKGCREGWILHPSHGIFCLGKHALLETVKVSLSF